MGRGYFSTFSEYSIQSHFYILPRDPVLLAKGPGKGLKGLVSRMHLHGDSAHKGAPFSHLHRRPHRLTSTLLTSLIEEDAISLF